MKKFLMIGSLCLVLMLFTGSAFADITYDGRCKVSYIALSESNPLDIPVDACYVVVDFYLAPQTFTIPLTAFGTQLNLALLKAWNEELDISCRIIVSQFFPKFIGWIVKIDFDKHPAPIP